MRVKKVLTFRASSIGDCLMGKYFLENIHVQYPEARYGIIVSSRAAMIRDVLSDYPWIEILETNRRNPVSVLRLLRDWWGSDIVLTQYAGKRGGTFSLPSKIIGRILSRHGGFFGFADSSPLTPFLYDHVIPLVPGTAPAELERQAILRIGLTVPLPFPILVSSPDEKSLEHLHVKGGTYYVIHLFAGNTSRGLSPENQRKLVQKMRESFPNTTFLLSGAKEDSMQIEEATRGIPHIQILAGSVSLNDMKILISASRGVVSVDTGLAHMSAQLRKPLVVLGSCLGLAWWGPNQYGIEAPITVLSEDSLCETGHVSQEYPACLNSVSLDAVVKAVQARFV